MKIELTASAARHARTIDAWWHANRPAATGLFSEELSAALEALAAVPLSGLIVRLRGADGVRRVVLRSTRHHVYYRVEKDTVTVVAIWSAVRGRGPTPAELRGRTPRPRKR